jgi:hypothetical protein
MSGTPIEIKTIFTIFTPNMTFLVVDLRDNYTAGKLLLYIFQPVWPRHWSICIEGKQYESPVHRSWYQPLILLDKKSLHSHYA